MSRILVHFYGYKSKELPHAVKSILANSSGQNEIDIVVFDQLNLERRDRFDNAEYNYIHWDNLKSRFSYLNQSKNRDGYDFFLYVDGAKIFQGNWDMELVMGHGGRNVILSGNHSIVFNKDNYKFYSDYTLGDIDHTLRTNWIVKDFIFMSFDLFKSFPDISMIKYNGFEELYSLFAAQNNIEINAIATAWVEDLEPKITEHDFVPFSINHNYSMVVDCLKGVPGCPIGGSKELSTINGYDFSMLNYLPYQRNDIAYDPIMDIDSVGGERFHDVVKSLY
jgi:hypothetical protein